MGSRSRTLLRASLVFATALASGHRPAAALSNPNQFCTGDPCVIASPKNADPGAVLDFGTRAVVLQSALTMLPLPSGAIGSLTIKAGSFSLVAGGQIKGFSASKAGGSLTINVVNDIQIANTFSTGAIRLSGQDGGTLTLTTTGGSVSGAGRITVFGDGIPASGGTLTVTAASNINLTGPLDVNGGAQGSGGSLQFTAGGNMTATGGINFAGGASGGGDIDIDAGGSLTLGAVDMSGSGDDSDGGLAIITADGNVSFIGAVDGRGSDSGENCGDGADIDVTATGDITISADMRLQGRGANCTGGSLSLDGARLFLSSVLDLGGTGSDGDGGDFDVTATNLIRFTGTLAIDGGSDAGDFSFDSDADLEIGGTVNAQGRLATSQGGVADIVADRLTVSGTIDTTTGNSAPEGTDLNLTGCDIVTQPTAVLRSLGAHGSIVIRTRDTLRLRGRLTASAAGGITLRYSAAAAPLDTVGAVLSPPAQRILDTTIRPCRRCATLADCDDGSTCTIDSCVSARCMHTPTTGSCNDGDACTLNDTCSGGACIGTPMDCNDSDPCTDDLCSAGACSHPFNTAPCTDGDACTSDDRCSGDTCVGGAPTDCNDHDVCTTDSCEPLTGCAHSPVADCFDKDHDEKPDDVDECLTLSWTEQPSTPPNQNPSKFAFSLSGIVPPDRARTMLIAGLFNVASDQPPLDPTANGVHLHVEDQLGALFDLSIPSGAGCNLTDGWFINNAGTAPTWRYRNRSGALPPGCAPGSALGIESVQIKDRRARAKDALQFKVKARNAALQRLLELPLTRLRISLALAAEPSPGIPSAQAKAGQCGEALFTGNPIASKGKPSCKPKVKDDLLIGLRCKGQ